VNLNTLERYGEAFFEGWRPKNDSNPFEKAIHYLQRFITMVRIKIEAESICYASDLSERRLACSCYLCFWDLIDLERTFRDAIGNNDWNLAAKVHSLSDSIVGFFKREIMPLLQKHWFMFSYKRCKKIVETLFESYGPLS